MEEEVPSGSDNIVTEFNTYEEFLNSQITSLDLFYLEVRTWVLLAYKQVLIDWWLTWLQTSVVVKMRSCDFSLWLYFRTRFTEIFVSVIENTSANRWTYNQDVKILFLLFFAWFKSPQWCRAKEKYFTCPEAQRFRIFLVCYSLC